MAVPYCAVQFGAAKGAAMRRLSLVVVLVTVFTAPVSAQEPVRVGVLTIRSGPIASCGRQMEDGLQFALKERGGAIAGRKVEVYFCDSAGQPAKPRTKKLGYKRIATIADDFAYGHEHTGGFHRTFEENGGKIVQKLWPPITTPDYAPYIAQLKTNVDAVYAGFGPTNGQRFLKQYNEFGVKLPVLGMVTTTEESSLKSMGDEALGVITPGTYSAAIDTPTNRKWVQAMRAEYKDDPGYCTIGGYLGVLFIEAGMKGVNGKIEEKTAFMKALRAVQLADTPQGPIRLDAYGNPIVNVLHPKGRAARGTAHERRYRLVPRREPVLEVRAGHVPGRAGLLARLPAVEEHRVIGRHGSGTTSPSNTVSTLWQSRLANSLGDALKTPCGKLDGRRRPILPRPASAQ